MKLQFIVTNLRYGLRVLWKAPATTIAAILALALGIGVNISGFISIDAMVLRGLPYPNLGRIVTLWETVPKTSGVRDPIAPANFRDWKERSTSFEAVGTYRPWAVSLTGEGDAERVDAARVSAGFFAVLGTSPLLGRTFADNERPNVVVVSEGFWRRKLASSPDVIGKTIQLGGEDFTVTGVMPDRFNFPFANQVWTPLDLTVAEAGERVDRSLMAIARLKPGIAFSKVQAESTALGRLLAKEYALTNEDRGLTLLPLTDLGNLETKRFTAILSGAAAFVLLLACANVANLQLARANSRKREIAVRSVLGASGRQIAAQLLAECVLLAFAGGMLGLLLAGWNLDFTKAGIPVVAARYVPGILTMHISGTVVVFTIVVSILTGVLCSAPAIVQLLRNNRRLNLNDGLKEGGRAVAGSMRNRLRSVLIVCEIVLALVQLVGAGLMVKAFRHMLDQNLGFNSKNVLAMNIALPVSRYRGAADKIAFYDRLLEKLDAGSRGAGIAAGFAPASAFGVEGRPENRGGESMPQIEAVSPGYWRSLAMPILSGRSFDAEDRPGTKPVVVISQAVARRYFAKEGPVGQRVRLGGPRSEWLTIVGVCGDYNDWFRGKAIPVIYRPYTQSAPANARLTLRSDGDPMKAAPSARAVIRSIDSQEPVYDIRPLENDLIDESSGVRLAARTMSIYALIALLLASTGIYAVISYFVTQRTHDIGIRMALGAARTDVLRLTMWQTGRLVIAGLAVGVPAAYGLSKVMSSVLFNVVSLDPAAFAAFPLLLTAAAMLASFFPARRATRIDPVVALRNE